MKNQIKAVLFDLDGVVVRTDKYHYEAWKVLCDKQGWRFSEEINSRLRGVSRMESLDIILAENQITASSVQKQQWAEEKNGVYLDLLGHISEEAIIPGVLPLIEGIRQWGACTAICSSSKNAVYILERLGLTGYFDLVVSGQDIEKTKPDPEIFLTAAKRLGVYPVQCLVFEDAASGIQAAIAAGMRNIGVEFENPLPAAFERISSYEEIDLDELLVSGRKRPLPVHPWQITETEITLSKRSNWDTLFALSNGYMGVRGTLEERQMAPYSTQGMYINGIYGYEDHHHLIWRKGFPKGWHAMLNLFDWMPFSIAVDGEVFDMLTGNLLEYTRTLDMKRGILERNTLWESPSGKQVRIRTERVVSMVRKHLAAVRLEVTLVRGGGEVEIESLLNHHVYNRQFGERPVQLTECQRHKELPAFHYVTDTTGFQVGAALGHQLAVSGEDGTGAESADFQTYRWRTVCRLAQGESAVLTKLAGFYTSLEADGGLVTQLAVEEVKRAMEDGFDALVREQAAFWSRFWETADIEIDGDPGAQQALRFNLFQLRQNHADDGIRSISATGLTGNNYGGHIFWDTEMYMVPFFLYTDPALVRPLLQYRVHILDGARKRAEEMDGMGALFPWMTISGEEPNGDWGCATAQYHINADIAHAIRQYDRATGDREFILGGGAETVFETARYLAHRGKFIPARGNQFCINMVCGPDEYGCAVNNNTYTNAMVKAHLEYALSLAERLRAEHRKEWASLAERIALTDEELQLWRNAAARMFINFNVELGIHEQDDSYLYKDPVDMAKIPRNVSIHGKNHPLNNWRLQLTKQADVVLLMFVLGEWFDTGVKKANYDFYEPKTTHGSSLSPAIHSIVASEIGYHQEAEDYFYNSLYLDLKDLRRNVAGGIHLACSGAVWMGVVNGFAGMRDESAGLKFAPVLPKGWTAYRFKLRWQGRLLLVDVDSDGAKLRLLEGPALSLRLYDRLYELAEGETAAAER
ncbi:beta-phosphoglucomutase [Paenibacillus sp. YN15]|uniref:beta-phosphoglucomutase n=1 Tax=Paenibacillus sp. YN15 TaxID=1742774 RepID=UPI000DCD563E|nr:beta-phosphoglucomutase [Paenibacillus sp. YN15]RAU95725.1 beta-phosphoglucomutase [Paenibacillus sp. YN15]